MGGRTAVGGVTRLSVALAWSGICILAGTRPPAAFLERLLAGGGRGSAGTGLGKPPSTGAVTVVSIADAVGGDGGGGGGVVGCWWRGRFCFDCGAGLAGLLGTGVAILLGVVRRAARREEVVAALSMGRSS